MTTLVEHAWAKLNLLLSVSSTIVDGKHQLQTVFATIDLADVLTFVYEEDGRRNLSIEMSGDEGLMAPVIAPEDNIVYQAVRFFEEVTGRVLAGKLHIDIHKRIPVEAGLGGGSADAAATLRVLCRLMDISVHSEAIHTIATQLGADVPFLLQGGCALMGGAGEKLICSLPTPALAVVLAKPNRGVSTRAAYAGFDADPQAQPSPAALLAVLTATPVQAAAVAQACANNLSQAACAHLPELVDLQKAMQSLPGVYGAELTGSGSAIFGICAHRQAALTAAACLRRQGYWTFACATTHR
jgi:4-diphosphocytidyl-2-C-methyl-D-erythritol kinase